MSRVLVYYGTTEGQTEKVATRIADVLRGREFEVDLLHGKDVPDGFTLEGYDGTVVGASVHVGKHQDYVVEFVNRHRSALAELPSAFFSVSLTASVEDEAEREVAEDVVEAFLVDTGWHPNLTAAVPGAVQYSKYGLIKRFVMKRISKRAGKDTDTSRDHEYTDWEDVEDFAESIADVIEGA
ncbi:MAG TPA: flavodoxin domain-containing protein [Natrialbaceae archaeon]|nr:flavodoxin domain-containing protein [Natrialbaceae archaeon]